MADATAGTVLETVNRGLARLNQALAGSAPVASTAPVMPQPSDQQIAQLAAALQAPGKPSDVQQMFEEGRQVVGEVLLLSSCYTGWDIQRPLGRYAAPDAVPGAFATTMAMLKYHPKSQCLTVQRVDDWQIKARNAFAFRALYVSDASGESRAIRYEFVKQPDGVWLLRRADLF